MPPTFYGLMTEEINFSYEGGLYGELIRNGTFKADAIQQNLKPDAYDPAKYYPATYPANRAPRYWSGVGGAALMFDASTPLNDALNVSLKVDAAAASKTSPAGVANGGFWGIAVQPRTTYTVSFFAKAAPGFTGPLTASIEGTNGTVLASAKISGVTGEWQKFEATLKTKSVKPSKDNVFKLTDDRARDNLVAGGFAVPADLQEPSERRPRGPFPIACRRAAKVPAFPRRQLRGRQRFRQPVQLEANDRPGGAAPRPSKLLGLLVHGRFWPAGISRLVPGHRHGAGAGGVRRLHAEPRLCHQRPGVGALCPGSAGGD